MFLLQKFDYDAARRVLVQNPIVDISFLDRKALLKRALAPFLQLSIENYQLIETTDNYPIYKEGHKTLLGKEDWIVVLRLWDSKRKMVRYLLWNPKSDKYIGLFEPNLISCDALHQSTVKRFYEKKSEEANMRGII